MSICLYQFGLFLLMVISKYRTLSENLMSICLYQFGLFLLMFRIMLVIWNEKYIMNINPKAFRIVIKVTIPAEVSGGNNWSNSGFKLIISTILNYSLLCF